jgi:pimeloyl-ACP methyl ester carboxylesterase
MPIVSTARRIAMVLLGLLALVSLPRPVMAAELRYSVVEGADGVPLLVAEAGKTDGPAILFIHGMSQSHLSWLPQLQSPLADRFRLVAFDMRGHGGSGKPWRPEDYSADRKVWANDIEAVIAAKGLTDITIVAWSFGGFAAVDYLRHHGLSRVRALNLTGTLGGLVKVPPAAKTPDHEKIMQGSRQRGSLDLLENIEGYTAMPETFAARPLPEKAQDIAIATGLMNPSYVRRAMTSLPTANTNMVPRLDLPVLISTGRYDAEWPVASAQALAEALPQGRLSLFEDAGHFPSMEDETRFNAELLALASGPTAAQVTAQREARQIAALRAKYAAPPSRFLKVDGVSLHYRDEGKGPVVILLPGHMGNLHMFEGWMPALKSRHRVIRLDWPPYGLSLPDPGNVYSSPRAAELVIGFMKAKGIKRAALVGTSNGATVAAHVAAKRPDLVSRLALSTFPLGVPPPRKISPELQQQAKLYLSNLEYRPASLFKAILEDIFADPANVTPSLVEQFTDINNHPGGYRAQDIYIRNNKAMYAAGGLPALYARIRAPTLLQWGDGGIVMPADLAQASVDILSGAPVVLLRYAKSGHMPMIEQPEETAQDLIRFLDGRLDAEARPPRP